MDDYSSLKLLFTAFLVIAAPIHEAIAYTLVTGTVFCDQCKDGQRSFFDYPISGIKVMMICGGNSNSNSNSNQREETTNWVGNYGIRFDGTPDLSKCYAQVSPDQAASIDCAATPGPPQNLTLMVSMFGMQMYAVDSLLSQPAQPMSYCPNFHNNPSPPTPVVTSPPPFRLPPLPPLPFVEASPCNHQKWTMPEYKCYWRAVNPEMKVGVIFGMIAARRYGNDITLWEALQGRGDPYRTLLREGTTALLNSYNSIEFPYNTLEVVTRMNWALLGSQRSVLVTALRFLRANSDSANVTCKFTPCQ